ncbi:OLC1v1005982C1 [Oldenlandia corymbosa var. corymbosa]|uniref:OLC1v1005982C1 n=1 Tax=Oldenlandia corymbosa var. corymbosa TaxID=529605 RepID=A0AAV1DGE4_OLDCO|nr:OLC1v1005982C1 [Oldenlandia corymbosa var. corymbosa]
MPEWILSELIGSQSKAIEGKTAAARKLLAGLKKVAATIVADFRLLQVKTVLLRLISEEMRPFESLRHKTLAVVKAISRVQNPTDHGFDDEEQLNLDVNGNAVDNNQEEVEGAANEPEKETRLKIQQILDTGCPVILMINEGVKTLVTGQAAFSRRW